MVVFGIVQSIFMHSSYFPIVRFISGVEKTIEPQEWVIDIAGQQVAVYDFFFPSNQQTHITYF